MRAVLLGVLGNLIFLIAGAAVSAAPLIDFNEQLRPVSGVIVDSSGALVRGADVTLRIGTTERRAISDAAGRFVFDGIPSGPATVTAVVAGFTAVTVDVDRSRPELRLVLEPESLSEKVTVRGIEPTVSRITTATKTDTPLRDVPQAVSVITRTQIAEQSMQSIGDVVRYVPGVGIAQGEGNRDTPIFRGNSSTSDFFVDGVRDDVQYFRDLYNVDHVEALKGPNAMVFGRGGVGGVINRVMRQADWTTTREATLQLGSWDNRRISADLGQAVSDRVAVRLTGMYENSDSYRQGFGLERYGVNPTMAFSLGENTTLRASYEHFHDDRTADRGIPSYSGRPVVTGPSTFFGNADLSHATVSVNAASSVLEHRFSPRVTLKNHTRYAAYDKIYQNVFPGAVDTTGTSVSLSAYNNATERHNVFNQTDFVVSQDTGRVRHTIVAGAELGRQATDNFRQTGYFTSLGPDVRTASVPVAHPVTSLPVDFRQSATDADNHGVATVAAIYVQDQAAFSEHFEAVVGLRYDRFDVDFTNNRSGADFSSRDGLLSPRVGLVYKPVVPMSVYASYTLSYQPRAGEQLSSLSLTNQALDPEQFTNYEVGLKWDVVPALSFSTAVYRLERSNVVVPDPLDPNVSLLVDGQQTKGVEIGLSGHVTPAWSIIGAYAYQDGEITSALSATAMAGARLAQLPKNSFSLWNRYNVSPVWGVGLGIIYRDRVFTSTDNLVVLPSFTRVDAATYFNLSSHLRAQVNVENVFDEDYFSSAHSNNNITPGSPRALRVSLTTSF